MMKYQKHKEIIRGFLDDFRYNHSLCVADEAVRLTTLYGGDADRAYLAGLLHDITKNFSREEHLKIIKMFDIILSDVEQSSIKLWHAITGAAYAKEVLKVNDDEIISSIRYHTTGKAEMSHLEKIIYLADYTSADRNYDDVDVMRKLVNIDMDKALLYALEYTVNDLESKGLAVHPDTVLAYKEIKDKIS